ncbi:MAG TPA: hypothetical protein VJB66_04310 [Candidatus Nanoarchaeia archaeon]|nr:hypothetical protein [Candidatus Nanoarchaeia archaeon]
MGQNLFYVYTSGEFPDFNSEQLLTAQIEVRAVTNAYGGLQRFHKQSLDIGSGIIEELGSGPMARLIAEARSVVPTINRPIFVHIGTQPPLNDSQKKDLDAMLGSLNLTYLHQE